VDGNTIAPAPTSQADETAPLIEGPYDYHSGLDFVPVPDPPGEEENPLAASAETIVDVVPADAGPYADAVYESASDSLHSESAKTANGTASGETAYGAASVEYPETAADAVGGGTAEAAYMTVEYPGTAEAGSYIPSDGGAGFAPAPWAYAPAPSTTYTYTYTITQTATWTTTPSPGSLFCFSVMMAGGYEEGLLKMQLRKGISIFACEEWSVFSSEKVLLSPGPPVEIRSSDIGSLKCGIGGPWHLALNSEIFERAWARVFRDEKYTLADWTVKADPDAVFLPARLRGQVGRADALANVYLNNCDQGLHGPIEVIARGGMETFRKGIKNCTKELSHEFDQWGEDVFLRHCLGLLEVNRVDNFQLLTEAVCFDENPVRTGCVSGKVSFHPFKTVDDYLKCHDQAANQTESINQTMFK